MMFSREEAKQIREEFWEEFRSMTARKRRNQGKPAKWLLNNTGIRALNLRFHVDRQVAQVGIDLETRNLDKRLELYEKLESLRRILEDAMSGPMTWELAYIRENDKEVSRIYVQAEGVDIYDRATWKDAHRFMYDRMSRLEDFFLEYRDYLKYASHTG